MLGLEVAMEKAIRITRFFQNKQSFCSLIASTQKAEMQQNVKILDENWYLPQTNLTTVICIP